MEGQVKSGASLVGEWSLPDIIGGLGVVTTKTVTLSVGSWLTDAIEGYIYRLAFDGMTADAAVLCSVAPIVAMEEEVIRCCVRCVDQGDGFLMFKSLNGEKPAIDIDMNILAMR